MLMKQLQCAKHYFKCFASIDASNPYNYLWVGITVITLGPSFSELPKIVH